MNKKYFWFAVLAGAVLTTAVSNLPFIGLINILCFAGFWASAIFAVWLYRRMSGSVTMQESLRIGLVTGLCAGVLGFTLSFFDLAGLQGFVSTIKQFIPSDAAVGEDIPTWGAIAFNIAGVLMNLLFGTIGGWIGGTIFSRSTKPEIPS